mgnify:CR=1 FL=1
MNDFTSAVIGKVLQKIASQDDAQQFVVAELSFANSSFLEVKNFANLSGVNLNPSPDSMSLNNTSLLLTELLMPLGNFQSTLDLRLAVIDQVMKVYRIGKYSKAEDRNKIREICRYRKVSKLLHFTKAENLASILDIGLNSKSYNVEIYKHHQYNDTNRFDDRENMISLSISYPNDRMFYKYQRADDDQKWVVIGFPSKILWEMECLFCYVNAATAEISSLSDKSLSGSKALEKMFTHRGGGPGKKYPYDSQAEVLVISHIPNSFIETIYVKHSSDVDAKYKSLVTEDDFYFNNRNYALNKKI